MEERNNVIYFDCDDSFYDFCVNPRITIIDTVDTNGNKTYKQHVDYTQTYKDAVAAGKQFVIKDPKSQINKHKTVSYRSAVLPVQNLLAYLQIPKKSPTKKKKK